MARYLTPLPGLLARAMESAFNQAIALDPAAAQRLDALNGKTVKLVLDRLGIDLFFIGQGQRLAVVAESDIEPATTIQGSPSALLAMAVPEWRAPGSGVRIEGDAGSAQALEKLFKQLDPDWEALLSQHLGDVLGHQVWRLLRDAGGMARHGARTAGDQLARYLREESGLLVTRDEANTFNREVDELREACDRLEARLRRARLA
jgi:ubiquinone biosynthesis accessory factor UbiJ